MTEGKRLSGASDPPSWREIFDRHSDPDMAPRAAVRWSLTGAHEGTGASGTRSGAAGSRDGE